MSLFERGVSASDLVASEARINANINKGVTQIMSAITDARDQTEVNLAAIRKGIQTLNDKISALQKSAGSLSAADQAALDQIVSDSNALAQAAGNVVP